MSLLKFGIIGSGSIAKKHIHLIKKKYPNSQIYILLHKKKIKSKFELNFFFKEKLFFQNNFDFIFICNPATRHVEYVKKCIHYKFKNIFVEKPLSASLNEAKKFMSNYSFKDYKLFIGYVLLFNDIFIKSLELLNKKKLGKIISANIVCNSNFKKWRKSKDFFESVSAKKKLGGGVLNELSHELSYALKLFGPIDQIYSKLSYDKNKKINVETKAKIICITKKDVNLGIFLNFVSKKEERYCKIIGTKGNLLLDFKNMILLLNNKKILDNSKKSKEKMYSDQLNYLIKNYKKKNKFHDNFINAFEVVKLIDIIKLSNNKNKIVRMI